MNTDKYSLPWLDNSLRRLAADSHGYDRVDMRRNAARTRLPVIAFLAVLFLAGCSGETGPATTAPSEPGTTAPRAIATFTPITIPTLTPEPLVRPLYRIVANLDAAAKMLTVTERVIYSNNSRDLLAELVLQFEPALTPGELSLGTISCDRMAAGAVPTLAEGVLHLPVDPPLAPGQTANLALSYTLDIPNTETLPGWDADQIYLGDWYAFFPIYREGAGWLAHPPGAAGEHLTYPYADFDITLNVQNGADYQIAASTAPEDTASGLHYTFTGRSFALALTHQPAISGSAGGVETFIYADAGHEREARDVSIATGEALLLYSRLYGPYPHARYTVLESDLPDGMEFDGLVFLSPEIFDYDSGTGRDYLTAITVHEAAHEWWYGRVGDDQALTPWLDESFAIYSELLYYKSIHPESVAWWWQGRVQMFHPAGCVDGTIYDFDGFRPYVNAVYLRGALMLDALRARMGKDAFLAVLRGFQDQFAQGDLTSDAFFRAFKTASPQPLDDIWKEYFCSPVAP